MIFAVVGEPVPGVYEVRPAACPARHPNGGGRCCLPFGHEPRPHRLSDEHRCHATGCTTPVKPTLLMCLKHWRSVPKDVQRRVWQTYRRGQCADKRPSRDWLAAAKDAIRIVAEKEGLR